MGMLKDSRETNWQKIVNYVFTRDMMNKKRLQMTKDGKYSFTINLANKKNYLDKIKINN